MPIAYDAASSAKEINLHWLILQSWLVLLAGHNNAMSNDDTYHL